MAIMPAPPDKRTGDAHHAGDAGHPSRRCPSPSQSDVPSNSARDHRQVDLATWRVAPLAGAPPEPTLSLAFAGQNLLVGTTQGTVHRLDLAKGSAVPIIGVPGHKQVILGPLAGGLNQPSAIVPLADGSLIVLDNAEHSILRATFTP